MKMAKDVVLICELERVKRECWNTHKYPCVEIESRGKRQESRDVNSKLNILYSKSKHTHKYPCVKIESRGKKQESREVNSKLNIRNGEALLTTFKSKQKRKIRNQNLV
jgi:hypothetical protein